MIAICCSGYSYLVNKSKIRGDNMIADQKLYINLEIVVILCYFHTSVIRI